MAPPSPANEVDLYLHVRVLISMILGLSVARLVAGAAGFIQRPKRTGLWAIHLGWVFWALLNVVSFWWWEFQLSLVTHWTFGLYLFIVFYASMYYLLAVLLFPDDLSDFRGYDDYLMARRGWFFGLLALTELLDIVDTWIKGPEHLRSLGIAYPARIAGFVVLCLIAARTSDRRFHAAFVVAALVYEVSFFSLNYQHLT